MPRQTRIPSYRLHKPSGQAVVRLSGKDFYLGLHGSDASQQEYRRLITEWLAGHHQVADAMAASHGPADSRTINELLVAYWEFATVYYAKNGQPIGEHQALKYSMKRLAELYGRTTIADFGPRALKAVRQRMIEDDLVRSLINARIKRIRRIFKWGIENDMVPPAVLQSLQAVAPLKRGRCEAREASPVRPVKQHRQAKHGGRRTPMSCGNRPGTNRRSKPAKSPGDRYTTESYGRAITATCEKAFAPPAELRRGRVEGRGRKANTTRWETDVEWRDRLGPEKWSELRAWRRAHRWSPNQLRHNAATYLRKQFGIEAARVVLGHSSAAVTEVYAEVDLAKAAEIMGKVG